MVTLLIDQTRLEIVLTATERVLSFRKGNVLIDRSAISKVQLTDDAWNWLRGVRWGGTFLPGAIAMGTWKSAFGRDFALIRRRRPSVVIDIDGHDEFERVIVTTRHGFALAKALRLDGSTSAEVVSSAR